MHALAALKEKMARFGAVLGLALVLVAPQLAYSEQVDEDPSALAMASDLVVARPVLLAVTAVGVVTYLVSLPFSLLGGNAKQAGQTLVVGPAQATFVRCLGCTNTGYRKTIDEQVADAE